MNATIENNYRYHSPQPGQPEKYEAIRSKAKELAYLIDEMAPNSREKSLASTKLEEAVMWANASIARNT
ncbi:Acb2/Tad1 domain-containing protein [Paenibacillus amylolyticus]|uniref:Acb2/Tad1 domain-containing protein n=1 Tax=Paenibacillus amylolyticus TaxID=1451 RepID=UPI003EBE4775